MPGLAQALSVAQARYIAQCSPKSNSCTLSVPHVQTGRSARVAPVSRPAPPFAAARRDQRRSRNRLAATEGMGPQEQLNGRDLEHLTRAAELSQSPVGHTQPHPYAACVLVNAAGVVVAEAAQWAQGTEAPECQAVQQAGEAARGATAYLNLETGDCHGESAAVEALVRGGVARVVVGLRHPLPHLRGGAIAALRAAGVAVAVLGEAACSAEEGLADAALDVCLLANEALLHRAVCRRPLGLLKYAMTLDGKIATHTGHSAWVSSAQSRQRVFEARAASDAVIVGGCTVRRDNPQLTTRREGGHQPARIVMSRTLDLPSEAKLWDVAHAPTIVATQRGARLDFQAMLRARGVEVLEFDFLTPDAVARYCHDRGFLQCLWECGGMLAAPAIAGGAIHKAMAFVAPKIIGGSRAPTPVGDLGFVEMTQALQLAEVQWQQVGPDLMLTGYLPQSGGLRALAAAAAAADSSDGSAGGAAPAAGGVVLGSRSAGSGPSASGAAGGQARHPGSRMEASGVAEFYKAWDRYGCLSNFSPHPIRMPPGAMTSERAQQAHAAATAAARSSGDGGSDAAPSSSSSGGGGGDGSGGGDATWRTWPSVEHYYQAQKFSGTADPEAAALVDAIAVAGSPEEAARLGRRAQRQRPQLIRPDWDDAKVAVMLAALRAKMASHAGPRAMLLATSRGRSARSTAFGSAADAAGCAASGSGSGGGGLELVESSPHDFFWGRGYDGSGSNMLGKLLMQVRQELLKLEGPEAAVAAAGVPGVSSPCRDARQGQEQQPAGV